MELQTAVGETALMKVAKSDLFSYDFLYFLF